MHHLEWLHIKQDLKALKKVVIEESGKRFALRTECKGNCGKIFQAVAVAFPPGSRPCSDRPKLRRVVPRLFVCFIAS